MKVTVTYYGQFRQVAGVEKEAVDIDEGGGIADVAAKLVEKHGEAVQNILLTQDNKVRGNLLVTVNDESIDADNQVPLKDGDEISLHTALSGG